MGLIRTYKQVVADRLEHHYGADKYTLTRVRSYVRATLLALIALVMNGVISVSVLAGSMQGLVGVITSVAGVGAMLVAFAMLLRGHSRIAQHVLMGAATVLILLGIYVSGGFPFSPGMFFVVALPMAALYIYGPRAGLVAAVVFPIIGVAEWYLEHVANILPSFGVHNYGTAGENFSAWLISYFLILVLFFLEHRESQNLVSLLEVERQKYVSLSNTDSLTKLYNYRKYDEEIGRRIAAATEAGASFSIVNIDLNRFKYVNDVYGHAAGDHVLQVVARRILSCVRERDIVARVGGDEFAMISGSDVTDHELEYIVSRIETVIASPISFETHMLYVSASIGVAGFPVDSTTRDGLARSADAAMYRDKAAKQDAFEQERA